MQQATVNLLADMGGAADDAHVRPGRRDEVHRHDTADGRPSRRPRPGPRSPTARSVTVTGTATDVGGRVAGVEVSTDGGTTLAPGERAPRRGPTPTCRRARARRPSRCAPSTTARTSRHADHAQRDGRVPVQRVRLGRPGDPGSQRPRRRRAGPDASRPTIDGYATGVRFYKGSSQHRHAHRPPVELDRPAAQLGGLLERDGDRLADRPVPDAGPADGRDGLRGVVHGSGRHTTRWRRTSSPRRARSPRPCRRPVASAARLPASSAERARSPAAATPRATTTSTCCSAPSTAPP